MAKLTVKKGAEKTEKVVDVEECCGRDWRKQIELIEEMRGREVAPVDELGCDRLADPHSSPAVQTLL